jgi:hypothetical protein
MSLSTKANPIPRLAPLTRTLTGFVKEARAAGVDVPIMI